MPSKSTFVIPTIEEVSDYMKEKKSWPKGFCDWYAAKFWHSYNSCGWRLSAGRGGPVKNWNSCFLNNWQTLKYKEDLDMLLSLTPKPKSIDEDTLNYLNDALEEYRKDPKMEKIRLAACYDWLKEHRLIKLSFAQRQEAIEESRKDLMSGKALAVTFVFDHIVNNLLTFNYFFDEVV
jgi:hypothetical protein